MPPPSLKPDSSSHLALTAWEELPDHPSSVQAAWHMEQGHAPLRQVALMLKLPPQPIGPQWRTKATQAALAIAALEPDLKQTHTPGAPGSSMILGMSSRDM